jgi:hypothetical protein
MIDINKEAEEYAKNTVDSKKSLDLDLDTEIWISGASFWGYLQGATKSKHVQAKIIQAKIDALGIIYSDNKTSDFNSPTFRDVKYEMNKLQQQLKQLENEIQ